MWIKLGGDELFTLKFQKAKLLLYMGWTERVG
jgi:hypothetical protein